MWCNSGRSNTVKIKKKTKKKMARCPPTVVQNSKGQQQWRTRELPAVEGHTLVTRYKHTVTWCVTVSVCWLRTCLLCSVPSYTYSGYVLQLNGKFSDYFVVNLKYFRFSIHLIIRSFAFEECCRSMMFFWLLLYRVIVLVMYVSACEYSNRLQSYWIDWFEWIGHLILHFPTWFSKKQKKECKYKKGLT